MRHLYLKTGFIAFTAAAALCAGGCSRAAEQPATEQAATLGASVADSAHAPAVTSGKTETSGILKPHATPKTTAAAKGKITYLQFGSVGCMPCRMMQPTLKYVEETYTDRVNVVFHDVWKSEGRAPAMERRIRVIPTQIFLDANGAEYFRNEGFLPKEEVLKIIESGLEG